MRNIRLVNCIFFSCIDDSQTELLERNYTSSDESQLQSLQKELIVQNKSLAKIN